ncbi:MAG: hypothetical protein IH991_13855 [Planctomycetes bacterium]|nr:hypothetical protein [Planctomycetota bacterium]
MGFFDGGGICVGRCFCAGLLVVSIASIVLTNEATQRSKQIDASLVGLRLRASDISDAFPIDLMDGEWEVTVLRQSCPDCKELLADRRGDPLLIAMFVDDVCAFYAEELPDESELIVSPIYATAETDRAIVMPASMQMRNGKVVAVRFLVHTEGVKL